MLTFELIEKYVDDNKDEALKCLVEVLQSPSPTGKELPNAETIMRWIKSADIPVQVYEYQKDRPNIIAEWKGSREGATFLFNGHFDVFPPAETTDESIDPWSGKIEDGWAYGAGSSDMKSGDAAAVMAVKFLKEMGFDPKGSITLNFVSDEENGGEYGILPLLEEGVLKGDFGISMEPTDMNMLVGHGGTYPCRIVIHGDGGHASEDIKGPESDSENIYGGEDAIKKAMKAVAALHKLADELKKRPRTALGQTHLAVTKINAGIPVNNYPRRCEICIDRRYMTGETPESVDAEIIAVLEKIKEEDPTFVYEFYNRYEPDTPIFEIDENSDIVKAIDEASETVLGKKPIHFTRAGGADAAYIKKALGTQMPWFGPGNFDVAIPKERVSIDNYLNCIKVYMLTMVKMMA